MTTFSVAGSNYTDLSTALTKTGKIAVKGTAAEINTALSSLETNYTRLSSVSVANGGHLSLNTATVSANKDVILRLSAAVVDVSDTGALIKGALTDLTSVKAKINMITASDALTGVTGAQVSANKDVLLKLTTAAVEILDTGAGVAANYSNIDKVYSKISGMAESVAAGTIDYSVYNASKNGAGINAMLQAGANHRGINITNFAGTNAALNALVADTSVKSITIKDTIANLTQSAAIIQSGGSTKIGVGSVTVSDKFANLKTAAAQTLITSFGTKVGGVKMTMNASEATAANTTVLDGLDAANNLLTDLTVSDSSKNISANSANLATFYTALATTHLATAPVNSTAVVATDGTSSNKAVLTMSFADFNVLKTPLGSSTNSYVLKDVNYANAATVNTNAANAYDAVQSFNIVAAFNATTLATATNYSKVTRIDNTATVANVTTFNNEYDALSSAQKKKVGTVAVTDTATALVAAGVLTALANNAKVTKVNATAATATDTDATSIKALETSDAGAKIGTIALVDTRASVIAYQNQVSAGTKPLDRKVSITSIT